MCVHIVMFCTVNYTLIPVINNMCVCLCVRVCVHFVQSNYTHSSNQHVHDWMQTKLYFKKEARKKKASRATKRPKSKKGIWKNKDVNGINKLLSIISANHLCIKHFNPSITRNNWNYPWQQQKSYAVSKWILTPSHSYWVLILLTCTFQ